MSTTILKLLSATAAETPDAELLARFIAGRDEAAFAELVRRHGPAVHRACRQILGPSSADDAFQAAFLVLACRARSVRKSASVGSWLIGVAGRVARQMRKRSARSQEIGDRSGIDASNRGDSLTPDSRLLTSELAAVLAEELARLPENLRDPVVLCLVRGRTHAEAAAELGGSARTVRRRLGQAKTLLQLRLERRGIVPAVAAGMVASLGPASAISSDLVKQTVEGVFSFLAGSGAVTPAAVIAKGVVGSMVKIKVSAAMAVMAATLIGLGVVWADEKPAAGIPPLSLPRDERLTPAPAPAKPVPPVAAAPSDLNFVDRNGLGHRTPNFVVIAPTAVMARAVANEAEYQRRELAKKWLGQTLPDWQKPCTIRVVRDRGGFGGATAFTFQPKDKDHLPGISSQEMQLNGSFESVVTNSLPHEVMHTVLATHFGKPLPRWADEGIALLAESGAEQANHDIRCRELLASGRGIRLNRLFEMNDYPRNMIAVYAQGHSVVRFLLTRWGARAIPTKIVPHNLHHKLIRFLEQGMAAGWDKAANEVYGFRSVDEMEEAWIDWLKRPESKLSAAPEPVKPVEPVELERIPPVPLSDATAPAPPAPRDVLRLNSRKMTFPLSIDLSRDRDAKELCVYVSRDQGRTWTKYAAVSPDQTRFTFEAPEDGLYWLSGVVVNKDGTTSPSDLRLLAPAHKLLIDTMGEPETTGR